MLSETLEHVDPDGALARRPIAERIVIGVRNIRVRLERNKAGLGQMQLVRILVG